MAKDNFVSTLYYWIKKKILANTSFQKAFHIMTYSDEVNKLIGAELSFEGKIKALYKCVKIKIS